MNTELELCSLVATAAAGGNTETYPIEVGEYRSGLFFLKATLVSGSGNLNASIMTYDAYTTAWYTLVAFTQLTNSGSEAKALTELGKRIAIVWTNTGGSSPVWTFKISAVIKD
jgi:hypothetical protein